MRATVLIPLLATACGGPAIVAGDIGPVEFEKARSAWYGGSFIVVADEVIPCDQMGWVSRGYTEGTPADGRRDFAAVQIAFSGPVEEGAFMADRIQGLNVTGLVNTRDDVQILHAREGEVVVDNVGGNSVSGTFSIAFADSGIAGEFDAEYCVNLD